MPRRALLLSIPCVFIAHFLEEVPRFVEWFNAHVPRGITEDLFWTVNGAALVLTVLAVVFSLAAPSQVSDVALFGWLSFLFAANAILHVVGALADGSFVPGLITAVLLYIPAYVAVAREVFRARRASRMALAIAGVLAAIPMLVHGYLIIFKGDRLF